MSNDTKDEGPVIRLSMGRLTRNYTLYTVILAGFVSTWGFFGWGFPLVLAKDREIDKKEIAHQFEQIGGRVERLESEVSQLSTTVLEGQELQLIGLLNDHNSSPEERARLEQQLRKVKFEIERRVRAGYGTR